MALLPAATAVARDALVNADLVVFAHLPKTGGTTLQTIIAPVYGRENCIIGGGRVEKYERQIEALAEATPATRAIAGHFFPGVDAAVHRRGRYVTLLRDPVDRATSHYFHTLREAAPHELIHEMPMIDFLAQHDVWHNYACRFLASRFGEPLCPNKDGILARAQETLETFEVVGLSERFDASLLLMARRLGWIRPWYRDHNRNPSRARVEELPRELVGLLTSLNNLDMELYRWASARFEAEVGAQGVSFRLATAAFPAVNSVAILGAERLAKLRRRYPGHFQRRS
ncbi:MAG: hypothetical protein QOH79_581 [Acidimicrobiaceae bacterium]